VRYSSSAAATARPADPDLVRTALADAAGIGPYFVLSVGAPPGARPAHQVYQEDFPRLIAGTATQLGTAEARVAASTFQLSYAARLWSPVLASALRRGVLPDLAGLRIAASPALRLSLPDPPPGWQATEPAEQAALAYRTVMTTHLEPLAARFPVKIAPGLLDGNAAAALTGALRVLTATHPNLAAPARALAGALLGTGRLAGTLTPAGPGLEFTRRSCCLYYRVPGGGLCGDCPLTAPPGRKP
jgi:FhuF 2Fe-2S C-terminal domain